MLQVLILHLFQQRNNIFGYNLKALGVQVQTVIAIFFCKSALFIGQHFCKVEPLHLAVKSDFVQFFVSCQTNANLRDKSLATQYLYLGKVSAFFAKFLEYSSKCTRLGVLCRCRLFRLKSQDFSGLCSKRYIRAFPTICRLCHH